MLFEHSLHVLRVIGALAVDMFWPHDNYNHGVGHHHPDPEKYSFFPDIYMMYDVLLSDNHYRKNDILQLIFQQPNQSGR